MRPDPASSLSSRSNLPTARQTLGRFLSIVMLSLFGLFAHSATASALTIHIDIGLRSMRCTGFGICSISVSTMVDGTTAEARLAGRKLSIRLDDFIAQGHAVLPIDSPIEVDAETAEAFGVKSLVILPGNYPIDFSRYQNGEVVVDVVPDYLHVGVNWGRRSRDCHGFGICSIVITIPTFPDALDRLVDSYASVDGDVLHVAFAESLPDQGDSIVIDEDIELDPKLSARLGAKRVLIAKGVYPVDYESNPNGSVDLPLQRFGITISIRTGRKSKDCHGFGICSVMIDVDLSLSDGRDVPVDGILIGLNRLRLSFLAELPEQGDVLTIDEPIVIDGPVAKAMGAGEMTILPGEYRIVRDDEGNESVDLDVTHQSMTIWVKIGQPFNNCRGFGICAIGVGNDRPERSIFADARLDGTTLTIAFGEQAPDAGEYITIDEPIQLDKATAKLMESCRLTILPGRYKVDYSSNPFGTVTLRTLRFGLSINIEIGRKSMGCTGMGICSITIDLSNRTVPALASIEGKKLRLMLRTLRHVAGDALTIDEDITLDPEQARGLGHSSVTLKRGIYPIVLDSNGEQVVDIDVETQGLVITIKTGRPGCRPGFGICRIDIDLFASERAVQAVASLDNGELVIDLLGETPDGDAEELMVIEESIALDAALLKALGYDSDKGYAIRAGAYPVDTSENRHGTLRLSTERIDGTAGVEETSFGAISAASATPNPTSGATTIGFTLSRPASVTLTVVDAAGNQVARPLENVAKSAGAQSTSFDATSLPAGIYYYTIVGNGVRIGGSVVVTR